MQTVCVSSNVKLDCAVFQAVSAKFDVDTVRVGDRYGYLCTSAGLDTFVVSLLSLSS